MAVIGDLESSRSLARQVVVDVGCGPGNLVRTLQGRGADAIGVDFSRAALREARARGCASLVQASAEALPFRARSLHVLVASDLVEHLLDPEAVVRGFVACVAADGFIYLTTPNAASFEARAFALLQGGVYNLEASGQPPWKWEHIRFFDAPMLHAMVQAAGGRVAKWLVIPRGPRIAAGVSLRLLPWRTLVALLKLGSRVTRNTRDRRNQLAVAVRPVNVRSSSEASR